MKQFSNYHPRRNIVSQLSVKKEKKKEMSTTLDSKYDDMSTTQTRNMATKEGKRN